MRKKESEIKEKEKRKREKERWESEEKEKKEKESVRRCDELRERKIGERIDQRERERGREL